jgi:hypothetical protein
MNFKCERFAVGSLERFGSFRQLAHAGDIEWREIVGVVSDFRSAGFASEIQPEVSFSYKQFPLYDPKIVIRAASDPPGPALANAVREEPRAANPAAVVVGVRTLDDLAASSIAEPRSQESAFHGSVAASLAPLRMVSQMIPHNSSTAAVNAPANSQRVV